MASTGSEQPIACCKAGSVALMKTLNSVSYLIVVGIDGLPDASLAWNIFVYSAILGLVAPSANLANFMLVIVYS